MACGECIIITTYNKGVCYALKYKNRLFTKYNSIQNTNEKLLHTIYTSRANKTGKKDQFDSTTI